MLMIDGPAEDQLPEQAPRLSRGDLRRLAPYCRDPDALRESWRAARLAPWSAQRQILMSHWLPRWLTWQRRIDFLWTLVDADGFQPVAAVSPEFRASATAKARREYAHAFAAFRPGDASLRALGDLVAVCRAENIPVAFFAPPVSPAFRAEFATGVFEAGERYTARLGRKLGVPVFPALSAAAEDEFIDGHHQLRSGAERYSRWLADEHLKPWLAERGVMR
jgi:hypothetical protein